MTHEQRQRLIEILASGADISPEWSRILFPPEKQEYELVYHGKEREEDVIANTLAVPLQPVRTFNVNGEEWHNKLIFGDNLQVMKTLLEMKRRGELCNADGTPGVRLIYIDPPFATKREFSSNQDQKAYQDKIAGAKFVEFLRKRLLLIRELLSEDGSVYVHLDQKKVHYAKIILDEIFGEQNFRNEIIWRNTNTHNKAKTFGQIHQTLLLYTKSPRFQFTKIFRPRFRKYVETHYRHTGENGGKFRFSDPTGEGVSEGESGLEWQGYNPTKARRHWAIPGFIYELIDDDISKLKMLEKLDFLLERGFIRLPKKHGGQPQIIRPESVGDGNSIQDLWCYQPYTERIYVGTDEAIDQDVIWSVSDSESTGYPTQKPEGLLARIIQSSSQPGDIVLDAFSGSGTTCIVAEKLGRRWIGIECGKLAIYTIQKRLLNLKADIGNKGEQLKTKPFTLYNAGLYDFSRLKDLSRTDWRRFALTLFGCKDEPHRIGGIQMDGTLKSCPVLVFDYRKQDGATITEDTLGSIHEAAGSKLGTRMFIIAPAMAFGFQQDYIQISDVRYYALRIPYSIIHELHQREFLSLKQPTDEMAINDTVDAVGFDFIRTPELDYTVGCNKTDAFIRINNFHSEAVVVREPMRKNGNRETLSMVMLDYDYNAETDIFDLDEVFYASAIESVDWEMHFSVNRLGERIMAVFVDIYGNEARVVIPYIDFGLGKPPESARAMVTKSATLGKTKVKKS